MPNTPGEVGVRMDVPNTPGEVGVHMDVSNTPGKMGVRMDVPNTPGKVGVRMDVPNTPGKVGVHMDVSNTPGKVGVRMDVPNTPGDVGVRMDVLYVSSVRLSCADPIYSEPFRPVANLSIRSLSDPDPLRLFSSLPVWLRVFPFRANLTSSYVFFVRFLASTFVSEPSRSVLISRAFTFGSEPFRSFPSIYVCFRAFPTLTAGVPTPSCILL